MSRVGDREQLFAVEFHWRAARARHRVVTIEPVPHGLSDSAGAGGCGPNAASLALFPESEV